MSFATELGSAIERASRSVNFALEFSILNTGEPREISAMLIDAIRSHTGNKPTDLLFYQAGNGMVLGAALSNDATIVAKVHQPNRSIEALRAQRLIQSRAKRAGIPAPQPISGPVEFGRGLLTIDAYDESGVSCADLPSSTPIRRLFAEALVAIGELGVDLVDEPALTRASSIALGCLYQTPHSPIFDFDATLSGAEWIDDLAAEALEGIDGIDRAGPLKRIVSHSDLRAENVRIDSSLQRLAVIWDWDSVESATEAWHVGNTARAFSLHFFRNGGEGADIGLPGVADMLGFIDDYQAARSSPFSDDELRAALCHVQHALAYSARCEHALTVSQGQVRWTPGFSDRLREFTAWRRANSKP